MVRLRGLRVDFIAFRQFGQILRGDTVGAYGLYAQTVFLYQTAQTVQAHVRRLPLPLPVRLHLRTVNALQYRPRLCVFALRQQPRRRFRPRRLTLFRQFQQLLEHFQRLFLDFVNVVRQFPPPSVNSYPLDARFPVSGVILHGQFRKLRIQRGALPFETL